MRMDILYALYVKRGGYNYGNSKEIKIGYLAY